RVHTRLDDLEGDLALHGLGLLRHEDDAHAPFAYLLEQLVWPDHRAGTFLDWLIDGGSDCGGGLLQKAARMSMGVQQDFDSLPKRGIASTRNVKEGGSLAAWRRKLLQG